jgi:hypothetical protein
MTTISAQTILRSRHKQRPEKILSTLLLRYPRCIHAEFMTHRQLSRNASSSRAIPVEKLIKDVMTDPFIPLFWGKNQKGMQAGEECNSPVPRWSIPLNRWVHDSREAAWIRARNAAVTEAEGFSQAGYHKQIVNRLLEPFSHITVVASGTEWSNFRALREHPDAEPHIQILAKEIGRELDREDNIQTLEPGEWHLPFVMKEDVSLAGKHAMGAAVTSSDYERIKHNLLIKLSVARCASTSYKTVEGFDMTLERAIALHDKLVSSTPLHASPCEHVARADKWKQCFANVDWTWDHPQQHGNFVGFRQYRKMLTNECI